jgi:hypothetical protein
MSIRLLLTDKAWAEIAPILATSIGNSNGLFHRPHRPLRATLPAAPEHEARRWAA